MPGGDLVQTWPIDEVGDLLHTLDDTQEISCWLRHGQGMVGIGTAHSATLTSAEEAEAWWQELCCSIQRQSSAPENPMAAPVAFISFPFDREGAYEIVVPQILVGRRAGRSWVTTWNEPAGFSPDRWLQESGRRQAFPLERLSLSFHEGSLGRDRWIAAVEEAISRIGSAQLDKVVLARDEVAKLTAPLEVSTLVTRLAEIYPQTWTFCVRNLVGASPELLIRQDRGLITSRVLAGTIHGDHDPVRLAEALSSSSKDLSEHEYAVASVAGALEPHVTSLHVPEVPFVLQLPNVMHLASDITGAVRPGSTVVSLASAIHPSAAVCGTPTDEARRLIGELEHMDRGRYAGPVGWINAAGDGEIALALRCGLITDQEVRIFAGCGIVADSDPQAEWAETVAKLLPMKQALGVG